MILLTMVGQSHAAMTVTTATLKLCQLPLPLLQPHHLHLVSHHTHTHTHVHTHTHTHAHTHTHVHTHTHMHTLTHTRAHTHKHMHACTHAHSALHISILLPVIGISSFRWSGYLTAGVIVAGLTAVFVVVMINVMAVYFYRWRRHYSRLLAAQGNSARISYTSNGSSRGSESTPPYKV